MEAHSQPGEARGYNSLLERFPEAAVLAPPRTGGWRQLDEPAANPRPPPRANDGVPASELGVVAKSLHEHESPRQTLAFPVCDALTS